MDNKNAIAMDLVAKMAVEQLAKEQKKFQYSTVEKGQTSRKYSCRMSD